VTRSAHVRIVLFAAAFLSAAPADAAQTPDFSGVERFWSVASTLQQGREPDPADWDALFATPGYAALEERERRRAALQLGIRAALNPTLAQERDSILAANSWTARVIRHVQALPSRKAELESVRRQLLDDRFLTQAIALAQTLLPDGAATRWPPPPVAFIFFLPDGRGYPNIIVADLANVAGRADLVPFFAHELTHFYYAQVAGERKLEADTPFEKARLTLLTKLFEESLGDQHDKGPYIDLAEADFERLSIDRDRHQYLRDYRAQHATVSSLVAGVGWGAASKEKTKSGTFGRALPLEGRPLGFHMTRIIRRKFGDARLKNLVGDPIAWYAAFVDAARD
jgi:hypothetical protein